jgi:acetyl-CoA decarbonylase/synthase complex subunit gamma
MALTGLQIQKLLPKTNCKECGSNTCLAFAMKLAARRAEISECPDASDEAKRVLGEAYEPPVRGLHLGSDGSLKLGEETVLYRHERTFVHQTALAVNLNDVDELPSVDAVLEAVRGYALERVGEVFRIDMVAVSQKGSDRDAFVALAGRTWEETRRPLVLRSGDPEALERAAGAVRGSRSVLAAADPDTADSLWPVARDNQHALAVTAPDLNQLVELTARIKDAGFNDLLLQLQTRSLAETFQANSIVRRAALRQNCRPLGYPLLRFIESEDLLDGTVEAVGEIVKYGGICVLPRFDAAQIASLMTLRLNIYTDPQKPIQVEPKLYPIGEPTPDSPIFLTTNFSLTYFVVSGEIENAGISAWLVVPECEGMSVLTAWAAGKLSGASVAQFCRDIRLDDQVTRREIIIPGYVAQISGELEENLPGWTVVVGPQEASELDVFIKARVA